MFPKQGILKGYNPRVQSVILSSCMEMNMYLWISGNPGYLVESVKNCGLRMRRCPECSSHAWLRTLCIAHLLLCALFNTTPVPGIKRYAIAGYLLFHSHALLSWNFYWLDKVNWSMSPRVYCLFLLNLHYTHIGYHVVNTQETEVALNPQVQ